MSAVSCTSSENVFILKFWMETGKGNEKAAAASVLGDGSVACIFTTIFCVLTESIHTANLNTQDSFTERSKSLIST